MIRVRLLISGKVQGVWYRQSTLNKAHEVGVTGTVKNLDDGRVEAEIQGSEAQVQSMINWCHTGPEHARVDHIDVEDLHLAHNETSFLIMR